MRLVTGIKYLLVLCAFALTTWLFIGQDESRSPMDITVPAATPEEEVASSETEQPVHAATVLIEPRYTGRDIQGQAWEIQAQRAEQKREEDANHLLLTDVDATFQQKGQEPLTFEAEQGVFVQKTGNLTLQEDVHVRGFGFELTTELLSSRVKERTLVSPVPVLLKGNFGTLAATLKAGRLDVSDQGNRFLFSGHVKGQLTPTAPNLETIEKESE